MQVGALSQEDPLEGEMATHSRILAWIIPRTEEPGRLQSTGLQRVGHNLSDLACVHWALEKWTRTSGESWDSRHRFF